MPYLDDDMDDLFLRASEDIRLRAEEDDWDKIQKRLLPDDSIVSKYQLFTANRMNFRFWACLLFILILSGITTDYVERHTNLKTEIGKSIDTNHNVTIKKKSANEFQVTHLYSKRGLLIKPIKLIRTKLMESQDEFQQKSDDSIIFALPAQSVKNSLPLQFDILKNTESAVKKTNSSEKKRIYVGVVAGPQFNQTKKQGYSDAGLSLGLLLGFHLNNRWAIESALIISHKQYSSAGQYFDMSKISGSMPPGMKLIQVQSNSTVLEIPVKIKYDVLKCNQEAVFLTGGLSSYILTRENNQYQASVNGHNETMSGHYATHQSYFASAINISAGYEWIAGKNINLRVEPYLQIPLKSIGMGSMHVVSTGVYLGITFPVLK